MNESVQAQPPSSFMAIFMQAIALRQGVATGKNWGWAAVILAAGSIATKAQDAAGTTSSQPPHKTPYHLFNPTPSEIIRETSADRADKTDCPVSGSPGPVQIATDSP